MPQLDNRKLLQSVIKLIEKPDIKALERSLIVTLREIITAESIEICRLYDDPDVPDQKLLVYVEADETPSDSDTVEAIILDSVPEFVDCLHSHRRAVLREGAKLRIIHPISTKSEVVGFLVLECAKDDPHDQEIVSILLTFYKNYASLLHDSQRDELTGLLNRKVFDEKVLQLIASMRSAPPPENGRGEYCLALLDIDYFKKVNDELGHLVGDETLVLFARAMVEAFRGADLLFRIGGEEFVVVLRDVDLDRAIVVLERFRHIIEQRDFPQLDQMTISVGVSMINANDFPTNVLDRADKALYSAKTSGRNRVCAYEHLVAEGKLRAIQRNTDAELF